MADMHLMAGYDAAGNETAAVCDCWFGEPHLGVAEQGNPVIGAAASAGDLTAVPGHQTWSAGACGCGFACPSIDYWRAHDGLYAADHAGGVPGAVLPASGIYPDGAEAAPDGSR
jgi:hypothetical protein